MRTSVKRIKTTNAIVEQLVHSRVNNRFSIFKVLTFSRKHAMAEVCYKVVRCESVHDLDEKLGGFARSGWTPVGTSKCLTVCSHSLSRFLSRLMIRNKSLFQ
jgi:hypothetical protein